MAPRKPKPDDDASSTTSELPLALKPKNEKAKITKLKAEKAKSDKSKTEKPKAVKKDKVEKDVETAANVGKNKGDSGGGGGGVKKESGGKEKVKAVNGEEAIEVMKKYLKEQNRPYSATEVSANLHGKVRLLLLCSFRRPDRDVVDGGWWEEVNRDKGHEDGSG
jgi:26S proteasome regulatory subunit, ATPase 3, interacting protein